MMEDLCGMTLVDVAHAIRHKKVSSLDVTKACLDRLERLQPDLNCFLSHEPDGALAAAHAADVAVARGHAHGPLHGVPLAHKDIFHRRGQATTCGSRLFGRRVADSTSTVLARLSAAGAISLGTLNLSQLCYNPYGFNDDFGRCRNPWKLDRISGGSSSGSASAVAARIVFAAMGSDTGGSIRLPAAMCGVVGLLPTRTRVSSHGVVPLTFSLDNTGPIARSVRDCARLLRVIAGSDPLDPCCSHALVPDYEAEMNEGVGGCRIGVVPALYDGLTAEVERCLRKSLDVYRSLGCMIVDVEIPDLDELNALADIMELSEIATVYGKTHREHESSFHPVLHDRIQIGLCISATDYLEARRARGRKLAEFVDRVFTVVDILHLPVMPSPAPAAQDIASRLAENPDVNLALVGRMTQFANYLGVPALSVPCGFSADRLPIAFQLLGPPFCESRLFRIGHAFQSATEHHLTEPDGHERDGLPCDYECARQPEMTNTRTRSFTT